MTANQTEPKGTEMITQLREYEAQNVTKDRRVWLGQLTWFGVTETTVRHADLAAKLEARGLHDFIPAAPKDDDVFRRTFFNGQRRHYETDDPEVMENHLLRQVGRKDGVIVKRIVIETVDTSGHKLGYREAIDIRFDSSKPSEILVKPLGDDEDSRAWELASTLGAEYHAARGCVDARAVRDIIRQVLAACMAVPVRTGGGVYFVPMDRIAMLDSLEAVAAELPDCMVHSLPLIDDKRQRDMLQRAVEAETVDEIDRIVEEIAAIVKSGKKVSTRQWGAFAARHRAVTSRTKEYSGLLEQTLEQTDDRLRILGMEMANLLSAMEQ